MDPNTENETKMQELHMLEHNLQNTLMQKQSIQIELSEIDNALSELKKASGETYKIISGIMVKSDKEDLEKDLGEKKNVLELRLNSIEKQEKLSESRALELKEELTKGQDKAQESEE